MSFFATCVNGELVVKLPAERIDQLVADGLGHWFESGRGRPLREWIRLRPGDGAVCAAYVGEARSFVAG